jgi:FAD/FMN-containing dehydrogenase
MTLQAALQAIVGAEHVLSADADIAPYCTDWRRQYSARAECVVRPASTQELSRVVAHCAGEAVGVVPQGGNTSLCGAAVPTGRGREIVVSLARMNRILALDALNDTVTVQAGCVLATVQQAARDAGRLFPLSLGAEGSCQIGGNLSTNAGGVNVLRYGNAREQVLGLEVVLPDGRVWSALRGLRKDNTGYDLKQLFIGAEGTLGIISAAVLRLYPLPSASATAWIALESPRRAVELLALLRELLGDRVSAFELLSRACVHAVLAHVPGSADPLVGAHAWYVLCELSDSGEAALLHDATERALSEAAERGVLLDAVLAQSEAQARALWRLRESIPEAQFSNVKHDISVPVSSVPELIARLGSALEQAFPGAQPFCFGHVGDGNLHYNVGPSELLARREAVNRVVYEAVAALGGSISAEHGLGQLKREEIVHHKPPLELELMRTLKRALDPKGIMNPGKVI